MVLIQRTITKDLENPMIFPKSQRDSKNYTIQPKSHKNKDLSFFAQGVFNFSSSNWESYIENVLWQPCTISALKINQKLNGKSSRS